MSLAAARLGSPRIATWCWTVSCPPSTLAWRPRPRSGNRRAARQGTGGWWLGVAAPAALGRPSIPERPLSAVPVITGAEHERAASDAGGGGSCQRLVGGALHARLLAQAQSDGPLTVGLPTCGLSIVLGGAATRNRIALPV